MDPEGSEQEAGREHSSALPEDFPASIAERFVAGTLREGVEPVETRMNAQVYRLYEQELELPGGGKGLLRVDYMRYRSSREGFDYINFDIVDPAKTGEDGEHPIIAAMDWYTSNGPDRINYDFALGHRYVHPDHREKGIGSFLYAMAEAWVAQVAEQRGKEQVVCIVARQKRIMDFAEGLGYTAYGLDAPLRREVIDHPERFIEIEDEVEGQPGREPFLYRTDSAEDEREPWNAETVWFRKVIPPPEKK